MGYLSWLGGWGEAWLIAVAVGPGLGVACGGSGGTSTSLETEGIGGEAGAVRLGRGGRGRAGAPGGAEGRPGPGEARGGAAGEGMVGAGEAAAGEPPLPSGQGGARLGASGAGAAAMAGGIGAALPGDGGWPEPGVGGVGGASPTRTGGRSATGGSAAGTAGAAGQLGTVGSVGGVAGQGATGSGGLSLPTAGRGGAGSEGAAGMGGESAGGVAGVGGCVDEDGDEVFVGCDDYATRFGPDCDDHDEAVASCPPRNVVLMLGDGMGFEQLRASRMFKSGAAWVTSPLSFETFPAAASMTTDNAQGDTTDSAASATAMATGHKVDNRVVSVVAGEDHPTVLEQSAAVGRRTGLVTIRTPVVDASPAAFGAHVTNRFDYTGIASDLLTGSRPNVLFGGTQNLPGQSTVEAAGYLFVTALDSFDTSETGSSHVFGAFASDVSPALPERAQVALEILSHDPEGFFLFIEHEGTDESGHNGDLAGVIDAALELEQAVDRVLSWLDGSSDTLVVVLADHETGGLTVTEAAPQVGVVPAHTYGLSGHSSTPVPLFARGPRAELVAAVLDNTDVYALLGGT